MLEVPPECPLDILSEEYFSDNLLKGLRVYQRELSEADFGYLARHRLEVLEISQCELPSTGLSSFHWMPALRGLWLRSVSVAPKDIRILSMSCGKTLEVLVLDGCRVSDAHVDEMVGFDALRSLDVSGDSDYRLTLASMKSFRGMERLVEVRFDKHGSIPSPGILKKDKPELRVYVHE